MNPAELVVHDVGLVRPLRKTLRTRHIQVRLAGAR
jgi:hypothetical protein